MMIFLGTVAAYFIGSFPTSFLLTRALKGVDIREHGSGNAGATNVYRVVGKLPGLVVLIADALKGWIPVVLMSDWVISSGYTGFSVDGVMAIFGVAAVCGHIWSPFLDFKGGKGVATATGVLIGFNGPCAAMAFFVWITVIFLTRYVSVGSIAAVTSVPIVLIATNQPSAWVIASAILSILIVYKHKANLVRLLKGEEHKIGNVNR